MKKILSNSEGFSIIEVLLVSIVVIAIAGAAIYVVGSKNKSKSTTTKNAVSTISSTNKTSGQITPTQTLSELVTAFKNKDKVKFESLISDGMKADAKANGVSSVYDSFSQDQFSSSIFTNLDYSSKTPAVSDYTSKKGVKGKQLKYTVVDEPSAANGGAKSTNVFKFSFVEHNNGWLLDDMGVDTNDNANINSQ